MIDLKKYGYPRKRDENEPDALVGPLPPVDAKPVAWMRDLDGTGSLHPASQGDPGSFPVYPAAAIIALQGEVQELNKLLSDGANGRALAAEAEVARLKAERDELQEALDLRWKADMRAITEWREVTGRELTLPDHIDLVHFLLMGLDLQVSENQKAEAEVARLKAELAVLTAQLDDMEWLSPDGFADWQKSYRNRSFFRDGQKTGEKR